MMKSEYPRALTLSITRFLQSVLTPGGAGDVVGSKPKQMVDASMLDLPLSRKA